MKIVIFTDVHANLPALKAVIAQVEDEGYDVAYHLGDAVGIGPFPAECLDLLLSLRDTHFVMGNHDEWLAHGLPHPQPEWMSDGELAHQQWTHQQIEPSAKKMVAKWPYLLREEHEGVSFCLLHYALDGSGKGFSSIVREPSVDDLDLLFIENAATDLLCYGHTHQPVDELGKTRYINPGALGCHSEPLARYLVLECNNGRYEVQKRAVPYNIEELYAAFEERQVPDREFICQIFFDGLLPS